MECGKALQILISAITSICGLQMCAPHLIIDGCVEIMDFHSISSEAQIMCAFELDA